VIVPEHDLIWREFRVGTSSDQSKDIASKKHFNNADAALEVSDELIAEGPRVVNSEASLSSRTETSLILIE